MMGSTKVMEFDFIANPNKLFIAGKTINGVLHVTLKPHFVVENIFLVLKAVSFIDNNIDNIIDNSTTNREKDLNGRKIKQKMMKQFSVIEESVSTGIKSKLTNDFQSVVLKNVLMNKKNKYEDIIFVDVVHVYNNEKGFIYSAIAEEICEEESIEFNVPLPNDVPPSVEDKLLYIRYTLTAMLEGFGGPDGDIKTIYQINCDLSINTLYDLNSFHKAMVPKTEFFGQDQSYLSCIPVNWYGSYMQAQLQINRRGFVPGEYIDFNAVINNRCSTVILYVNLYLIQILKFSGVRKLKRRLCECMRGSIMPFGCQLWKNERLQIPPVPCTLNSSNFKIKYKIQMDIIKSKSNKIEVERVVLKIPVVIGNMPLHSEINKGVYKEGPSNYLQFCGPIFPLAESGMCDSASKMDCPFVPYYIKYTFAKGVNHDDDDLDSVYEIRS